MKSRSSLIAALIMLSSNCLASDAGGLDGLSHGVAGIRQSIGDGNFAAASTGLGSLYDAGGSGFTAGAVDVRGADDGRTAALALAVASKSENNSSSAPPPPIGNVPGDEPGTPWGEALLTSAALAAEILLARDEPLDPDHRRDGGKSDNPTGDREVQAGIERQKDVIERRKLAQDPAYKKGFEDGRAAQEMQGAMEQLLGDMTSD